MSHPMFGVEVDIGDTSLFTSAPPEWPVIGGPVAQDVATLTLENGMTFRGRVLRDGADDVRFVVETITGPDGTTYDIDGGDGRNVVARLWREPA